MAYRIQDEAAPGGLVRFAVNPFWPLLGVMLGGVWLSWSWLLFNGFAVGSPTRRQEQFWIAGGLLGAFLISFALLWAAAAEILTTTAEFAYAGLALTAWKLGITYVLYLLQSRTIAIYEYYGGTLRNGLPVLLVAAFLVDPFLGRVLSPVILQLILG